MRFFVPLNKIELGEGRYHNGALAALRISLPSGQLVPVILLDAGDGTYGVKDGRHRIRIAGELGWSEIWAVVDGNARDEDDIAINFVRRRMDWLQVVAGIKARLARGLSHQVAGIPFGLSGSEVSMYLGLDNLAPEIQRAVQTGKIAPSAALQWKELPPAQQLEAAQKAGLGGMRRVTARKAKGAARKVAGTQQPRLTDTAGDHLGRVLDARSLVRSVMSCAPFDPITHTRVIAALSSLYQEIGEFINATASNR